MSTSGWLCLAYLGSCQIGLSYLFYSKGLRYISSLKAATIALVEPVLNPIWVFMLLGEVPTRYAVLGAIAVLLGVSLDLILNKEGS